MENRDILNESVQDLENSNFSNGIVQDNKLIFTIGDKTYRVRMPIQSEQSSIDHKRNLAQLEYLNQEGCITRKQLTQKLKDLNLFDMDKIESQKNQLIKEFKQAQFILATSSNNSFAIGECKLKIEIIKNELKNIAINTSIQLAPSLESRLEKFIIEYTTFLVTDIQDGKEWKRVWETNEEFQKADSGLVERCAANITWLLLNHQG